MTKNQTNPQLSIIVPVYNESAGLERLYSNIVTVMKEQGASYEILFIDDGSTDKSATIIANLATKDQSVQAIYLSRNFGKEQATTAGLHASSGQAAIMIDADGQHPVELIPKFIEKWSQGKQVVVGVRTANQKEGWIKRSGSKIFYRLLRLLGVPNVIQGSTDFRLIDRAVVEEFNKLTEHNRITRALIDWLGFERDYIEFTANAREHGEASYSTKKLIQLAINGFVSLSFTPLYLSGYAGVGITILSFIAGLFTLIEQYLLGDPLNLNITGTALLAVLLVFLVGILLIGQGLLAIYVARIYAETQNRPLYVTKPGP